MFGEHIFCQASQVARLAQKVWLWEALPGWMLWGRPCPGCHYQTSSFPSVGESWLSGRKMPLEGSARWRKSLWVYDITPLL